MGAKPLMNGRVEINSSSQPLAFDINVTFGATTGHGLGDRWSFTAYPANIIIPLEVRERGYDTNLDANLTLVRDALKQAIDYQHDLGLLSIRTSTEAGIRTSFIYTT